MVLKPGFVRVLTILRMLIRTVCASKILVFFKKKKKTDFIDINCDLSRGHSFYSTHSTCMLILLSYIFSQRFILSKLKDEYYQLRNIPVLTLQNRLVGHLLQ